MKSKNYKKKHYYKEKLLIKHINRNYIFINLLDIHI